MHGSHNGGPYCEGGALSLVGALTSVTPSAVNGRLLIDSVLQWPIHWCQTFLVPRCLWRFQELTAYTDGYGFRASWGYAFRKYSLPCLTKSMKACPVRR